MANIHKRPLKRHNRFIFGLFLSNVNRFTIFENILRFVFQSIAYLLALNGIIYFEMCCIQYAGIDLQILIALIRSNAINVLKSTAYNVLKLFVTQNSSNEAQNDIICSQYTIEGHRLVFRITLPILCSRNSLFKIILD